MNANRVFAIIPAAGMSRRMGKPKLLLPWNDKTIIEKLVETLIQSGISEIILVVRPDDNDLQNVLKKLPVNCVIPESSPEEMKASVQIGLRFIQNKFNPSSEDAWILTPADYPMVSSQTIKTLIGKKEEFQADIVIPSYDGKNGHPILLSWKLTDSVFQIPENKGINSVIKDKKWSIKEVSVSDFGVIQDIDTPEDYQKFQP